MAIGLVCLVLAVAPAKPSRYVVRGRVPGFHAYLRSSGLTDTPIQFAVSSFVRPLASNSFREFWRAWSSAVGYFLPYFVYHPLRRWLPQPAAILGTFLISGLLVQDLFGGAAFRSPYVPTGPILLGAFAVVLSINEFFRWRWGDAPTSLRVSANLACLAAGFAVYAAILLVIHTH